MLLQSGAGESSETGNVPLLGHKSAADCGGMVWEGGKGGGGEAVGRGGYYNNYNSETRVNPVCTLMCLQGCVAILSLTWIISLTVFGFLVLPKGESSRRWRGTQLQTGCSFGPFSMYISVCTNFLPPHRLLLQQHGPNGLRALLQQALVPHPINVRFILSHHDGAHVLLRLQLPYESLSAKRSDDAAHIGRPSSAPAPSDPAAAPAPASAPASAPSAAAAAAASVAYIRTRRTRPLASSAPPQSARHEPPEHGHEHGPGQHAQHD